MKKMNVMEEIVKEGGRDRERERELGRMEVERERAENDGLREQI